MVNITSKKIHYLELSDEELRKLNVMIQYWMSDKEFKEYFSDSSLKILSDIKKQS